MQARERQLISLKHRVKVLKEVSPLSQFKKRFYSACWWHWRDHFIGSFEELDWARARPSSIDAFAHSLTTTEAKFLESYRKAWPAQVYQLNQNPDSGFGATSQEMGLGYRDQQFAAWCSGIRQTGGCSRQNCWPHKASQWSLAFSI